MSSFFLQETEGLIPLATVKTTLAVVVPAERTFGTRPGLIHDQGLTHEIGTVQSVNCPTTIRFVTHLNKSEPPAPLCKLILDNFRRSDLSKLLE